MICLKGVVEMTILKASCDDCEKVIVGEDNMYFDHDSIIRCEKCDHIILLHVQEKLYADRMKRVKEVHIKGLRDVRKVIDCLKREIADME